MTQERISREHAVSPVVGVMLMLVVVIIIAALVSAFAGGLMQTEKKAPQASIVGKYSQYNGLTMTHMGGDSLDTTSLRVIIRPSDQFGVAQSELGARIVNVSCITGGTKAISRSYSSYFNTTDLAYWRNADGTLGVTSWVPGQSMYVLGGTDLQNSGIMQSSTDWPPCYNPVVHGGMGTTNGTGMRCYTTSLNSQINVGKTAYLEILTTDGKIISSSPMVIEP